MDRIFQEGMLKNDYQKARQRLEPGILKQRLYLYYRWVADQISDSVLNLALLNRYNIIWETTGESIVWTSKEIARIRQLGYNAVLVYPLVKPETIKTRLTDRALNEGHEAAPMEEMDDKIRKALENLLTFLKQNTPCPDYIIADIGSRGKKCAPDRIILYNNQLNRGEQKIIFDSHRPKRHRKELEKAVNDLVSLKDLKEYLINNRSKSLFSFF